jgi:hypothetical protein
LIEPDIAGEPQSDKRWLRQSLSKIQEELAERMEIRVSRETIRQLLDNQKIRLRSNVKRLHPKPHPDRDKQFRYLQTQKEAFQQAGWPVISVDTKKKELIGSFYQRGRQWRQEAVAVNTHDFPSYAEGRAVPYGIYDIQKNLGYVAVGRSADTPEFAVEAILWWWQTFGHELYPEAPELLILADGGGSNGYRSRRWKQQLQERFADEFGLTITVCHYPPGASKWNPIEHRLFSQISRTWAGTPLTSFEVLVDGIRTTTTQTGLCIKATLDEKTYEKGLSVSDDEMEALLIEKHDACPAWNYTIRPRKGSNF